MPLDESLKIPLFPDGIDIYLDEIEMQILEELFQDDEEKIHIHITDLAKRLQLKESTTRDKLRTIYSKFGLSGEDSSAKRLMLYQKIKTKQEPNQEILELLKYNEMLIRELNRTEDLLKIFIIILLTSTFTTLGVLFFDLPHKGFLYYVFLILLVGCFLYALYYTIVYIPFLRELFFMSKTIRRREKTKIKPKKNFHL